VLAFAPALAIGVVESCGERERGVTVVVEVGDCWPVEVSVVGVKENRKRIMETKGMKRRYQTRRTFRSRIC
jgi:mevalonate pyrophosphate decarboxylase